MRKNKLYFLNYLITTALVVVTDQLSKLWILKEFKLYESREIIPDLFNLVYVVNTGAAFSFLADVNSPWRHYFFVGVAIVALVGLTALVISLRKESMLYITSIGLIAGGAIGNLIDRVSYGHVVDFLDFYIKSYHWPAFNIADSAICVGVGIYMILTFNQARFEKKEKSQKGSTK